MSTMHIRLSGSMMGREYSHVTIREGLDLFSHAVLADQKRVPGDYHLDHRMGLALRLSGHA